MAQWKAQGNLNGRAVTQKIVLSAQQEYTAKEIKGGNGIVLCQLDYSSVRLWVSGNNDFSTATELSITLRGKKWNFTDGAGNAVLYETFYIWTQGTSAKDIILEVSSDSEGIDYYLGNSSINQSQIESYSSYAVQQMREIQDKPTTTNPLEVDTNISLENVNVCLVGSTAYTAKLAEIAELEAQLSTITQQFNEQINIIKNATPNPHGYSKFAIIPTNQSVWGLVKPSAASHNVLLYEISIENELSITETIWENILNIYQYGFETNKILYTDQVRCETKIDFGGIKINSFARGKGYGSVGFDIVPTPSGVPNVNVGGKIYISEGNNWGQADLRNNGAWLVYSTADVDLRDIFVPVWIPNTGKFIYDDDMIDFLLSYYSNIRNIMWDVTLAIRAIPSPTSLLAQIAQKRAELNSIVATDAKLNLKLNQYAYATILNFKIEGVNMIKLPVTGTSDSVGGFLCYATAKLVNPTPFPQILQFVTRSMLAIDDTDIAEALITIEFLSLAETDRINAILNDINAQASGYNTDNARNMAIKYTSGSGQVSKLVGSWDSLGDLINSITLSGRQNYSEIIKVLDSNSGLGILATCQVFTKNQQTANVAPLNLNLRHCIEIHLVGNKKPSTITNGGI